MADNFFVTAIVVAHDGATWLTEGIAALYSQTRPIDRIIAVDTGSLDNSAKLLSNAGIKVLSADRTTGFGDAINLALAATPEIADRESELIWILHDDCAPSRNVLEKLIEEMAEQPQVAIVGPKLRGWYDRNHLLEVGISIAGNGARWTGLERHEQDQGQHDEPKQVLAVSTAAMLARRDIFQELGGLDPNLALFRDDVDLGWRARVAGFTVKCVPQALVFHVEASANERRPIDVSETYFHRPLLLDRRNAAYVLMANSSFILTPWIALQLIFTALIRAITFLLAKLPGYAADEMAAVGLLLVKPGELLRARRERKKARLLSARVIKPFIPPRWSQLRLGWEHTTELITRWIHPNRAAQELAEDIDEGDVAATYSDIGVIDESFDDADLAPVRRLSRLRILANRPLLAGIAFTLFTSLLASRHRWGDLSGGALALVPPGARDLLSQYADSWHTVGMGSAAHTPPWIAILGLLSLVTLGNLAFFIAALFFLTPTLAFFIMYRSSKRVGLAPYLSVIAGLIYCFSPVLWNSINQGRIGTIVLALLLPSFLSFAPHQAIVESKSWRRIYSLALFSSVIAAFCAPFLLMYTGIYFVLLAIHILNRRTEIKEQGPLTFLVSADTAVAKRYFASALIPWLLTEPWSLSLLIHPTQFLQDPGFPLHQVGGSWQILLFNLGASSGVPWWIISPFLIFAFVVLLNSNTRSQGLIAWCIFALALALSTTHISGHGSTGNFWSGSLLIIVEVLILAPALAILSDLIPNLRTSSIGLGHFITALTALVATFSVVMTALWAFTYGSQSLVAGSQDQIIPPFVASLAQTPSRPKTLVIREENGIANFFISRGNDLSLGDPDNVVALPAELESAIQGALDGTLLTSSKIIGEYGIKYIFIKSPANPNIVRTIDGIGGYIRGSATSAGIIWRVQGALPRVSFTDANGNISQISAGDIGAQDVVKGPGVITIAEKYDPGWHLLLNGTPIKETRSANGVPQFVIPTAGTINLLEDGTKRRALISLELIALLSVIVLSLPAGRRRREVSIGESGEVA
jgi:GT2 family glycosyltransferase